MALSKKRMRQTSCIEKTSVKRLHIKETKHDRFGKRPAVTEAEEIVDRSTEADVKALRRSIELFLSMII